LKFIERRLRENGHMVIVVAEGAGQDLIVDSLRNTEHDASGNKLFLDVGLWLSQKIKVCSLLFGIMLMHTEFFADILKI
jgi:6-phosphofructokinase 1